MFNRTGSRFCQIYTCLNVVVRPQVYWLHNFARPTWTLRWLDVHLDIVELVSETGVRLLAQFRLSHTSDHCWTKVHILTDGSTARGRSALAHRIQSIGEDCAFRLFYQTLSTAAELYALFEAARYVAQTTTPMIGWFWAVRSLHALPSLQNVNFTGQNQY